MPEIKGTLGNGPGKESRRSANYGSSGVNRGAGKPKRTQECLASDSKANKNVLQNISMAGNQVKN